MNKESNKQEKRENMSYGELKKYLEKKNLLSEKGEILGGRKYCKPGTYEYSEGYNRQYYKGQIIDELRDLTGLEIAMIMDDGPAYFSSTRTGLYGSFEVTICLD